MSFSQKVKVFLINNIFYDSVEKSFTFGFTKTKENKKALENQELNLIFCGLDGTSKHLFYILQIILKLPKTLANKEVKRTK